MYISGANLTNEQRAAVLRGLEDHKGDTARAYSAERFFYFPEPHIYRWSLWHGGTVQYLTGE